MASTKRIDLFVTSDRTKDEIIDIAYARANGRDNDFSNLDEFGRKIYAHYYDVTHIKTGLKYMVFGADAQSILSGVGKCVNLLDKDEFLKGFSDEVDISSIDGTYTVELSDDADYSILAEVLDSSAAELRVENKKSNSFDIVLYDSDSWEFNESKIDCSKNPIKVSYTVVYK